jgi:hypothetical protein
MRCDATLYKFFVFENIDMGNFLFYLHSKKSKQKKLHNSSLYLLLLLLNFDCTEKVVSLHWNVKINIVDF